MVSFGGYVTATQVESLHRIFPNAKYHMCFDNDLAGKCFDVMTTYAISSKDIVKAHVNKEDSTVVIDFGLRKETYNEGFP